jgi:hypothetical protein
MRQVRINISSFGGTIRSFKYRYERSEPERGGCATLWLGDKEQNVTISSYTEVTRLAIRDGTDQFQSILIRRQPVVYYGATERSGKNAGKKQI